MVDDPLLPRSIQSWADIPTAFLHAELARRQDVNTERPACGSSTSSSYNTGIHVFALILILTLSVACTLSS
jgi:zinc transporter 1/2/3